MSRMFRRGLAASLLLTLTVIMIAPLPAAAAPGAQGGAPLGSEPRLLTGTYATTNPIYPTIGAETGVVLYDVSALVLEDFDHQPPEASQVLGTLDGDIVSGSYTIELPPEPGGLALDFDGDPSSPPNVQIFAPATFIDFLGDAYVNRGENALDLSLLLDPLTFTVTGGHVVVWAAEDGAQFPAGMGEDAVLFSDDDPLLALPAGWSVVSLGAAPFEIIRQPEVTVPIVESVGGLNDYSDLGYVDAWNRLFDRVKATYPFAADKDINWDTLYNAITPLVDQVTTDLEFHVVITRFGALIPDTHIGYVSVPLVQNLLMGGVGISRLALTDAGEMVVMKVQPGSPAADAGIGVGDLLLAVDGVPALRAVDDTPLLLNSASTLHGRRFLQTATLLQGPVGSEVALTWRAAGGDEQAATLTRVMDVTTLLEAFDPASGSAGVISSRLLDSGIGYIRVTGFAEDVSEADAWFARELQDLLDQGAQGIVLDVRDNGGGLVSLSMSMAGRFFEDYVRLFDFYYADGTGDFAYRGFVEILKGEPYYAGPVAVLVNAMTGSAGDMFAYAMTNNDRALIVGHTPSGGFTGEVGDGQYTLPGGLQMQVPTGRPVDPDTGRTLIEGTGVVPDIRVPVTVESLLSPEDEVLRAAEQALLDLSATARR